MHLFHTPCLPPHLTPRLVQTTFVNSFTFHTVFPWPSENFSLSPSLSLFLSPQPPIVTVPHPESSTSGTPSYILRHKDVSQPLPLGPFPSPFHLACQSAQVDSPPPATGNPHDSHQSGSPCGRRRSYQPEFLTLSSRL
ncbi:hypothetical protein LX32DRAFT_318576 [Colletotrichum zoysiae]|uniref:Uncharacterized protein n=1 Tax=Colletotrichum zoysiae TaxID=1216348 RepID=A0AAD9H2X9_9PEZI|nr:hypothetical protein LX32DRAFT_318576 [Colletotrichum zoysiae]